MDKQKRIEEMAQCKNAFGFICNDCKFINACERYSLAEELYNAGYRKVPEGAVIVSKKVWEEHIENWDKCGKAIEERVRKETAEKFAERVKEETDHGISALYDSTVDEICKEITEGKNGN